MFHGWRSSSPSIPTENQIRVRPIHSRRIQAVTRTCHFDLIVILEKRLQLRQALGSILCSYYYWHLCDVVDKRGSSASILQTSTRLDYSIDALKRMLPRVQTAINKGFAFSKTLKPRHPSELPSLPESNSHLLLTMDEIGIEIQKEVSFTVCDVYLGLNISLQFRNRLSSR